MLQIQEKGNEIEQSSIVVTDLVNDIVPVIYKILSSFRSGNVTTVSSISERVANALERLSQTYSMFDYLSIVRYLDRIIEIRLETLEKTRSLHHISSKELENDLNIEKIKGDIVRIITQNVLDVLSDSNESVLLNNKLSTIQSKRQKSGGFFSFDFDSIPDFEPIDRYVEALKSQQYDMSTLEKLLNVDVEDLFENYLWTDLLSSLESSLVSLGGRGNIEEVNICLAIFALYYRFMQAFKSHSQGTDAINSYLRYLSQQWNGKTSNSTAPTLLAISQYALFVRAIDTFSHHSACTCEKDADEVICRAFLLLSRGVLSLDDGISFQPVLHIICRLNGSCNFLQQLTRRCHPMSILNHALSTGLLHVLIRTMENTAYNDKELPTIAQTFFCAAFAFSIFDSVIGNLGLVAFCYKVCSDVGKSLTSELPRGAGSLEYDGGIGAAISIVPVPHSNKRFCHIQNTVSLVEIAASHGGGGDHNIVSEFDGIFAHILAMLPTRNSLMLQLASAIDDSFFSNMASVITFLLRVPAIFYAEIDQCSNMNMILDIVVDILETALTSSTNDYGIQILLEGFLYGVECCLECIDGLVTVRSTSRLMYGIKRLLKAILAVEEYSCMNHGTQPQVQQEASDNVVMKLYLLVSRSAAVSEMVTRHESDFTEFISSLTRLTLATLNTVETMLGRVNEHSSGNLSYSNLSDLVLFLVTVGNSSFIAKIANEKSLREHFLDIFIGCVSISSKHRVGIVEDSYVLQAVLRLISMDVEGFNLSAKAIALIKQAIIDEAKSMFVYDEALEWYGSGSASAFLSMFQFMTGMCAVGVHDHVLSLWVQAFVDLNAIEASQSHDLLELICNDACCLEDLSSCGLYPYFLRLLNICYYDFRYSVTYGVKVRETPGPDYRAPSEDFGEEGVGLSWDLTAVFRSIIHAKATCDITFGSCNRTFPHSLIAQTEQELSNWDTRALAMEHSQPYDWDLNLAKYEHLCKVLSWWQPGISSLSTWQNAVKGTLISTMTDQNHYPPGSTMIAARIYFSNDAFQYIVSCLEHGRASEAGGQLQLPALSSRFHAKESMKEVNFFAVAFYLLSGEDQNLLSKVVDSSSIQQSAIRVLVDEDMTGQPNRIRDMLSDQVSQLMGKLTRSSSPSAVLQSIGVGIIVCIMHPKKYIFDSFLLYLGTFGCCCRLCRQKLVF